MVVGGQHANVLTPSVRGGLLSGKRRFGLTLKSQYPGILQKKQVSMTGATTWCDGKSAVRLASGEWTHSKRGGWGGRLTPTAAVTPGRGCRPSGHTGLCNSKTRPRNRGDAMCHSPNPLEVDLSPGSKTNQKNPRGGKSSAKPASVAVRFVAEAIARQKISCGKLKVFES